MINLRKEVCREFIDDTVIEIFNRYQWGLKYLGVRFSPDMLEIMIDHSFNLENSLIAFCAWISLKQEQGERFDTNTLNDVLIESLQRRWVPTSFQKEYLREHDYILKSPRDLIWTKSEEILGDKLRNRILSDVTETYQLIFMDNLELTSEEENKVKTLQEYIRQLRISFLSD